MFTDIVGYSALMQENEQEAVFLLNRYKRIIEKSLEESGGTLVQFYGDGSLQSFDGALQAVDCGLALQRAFRLKPAIPVRIGIHLGEVLHKGGFMYGDSVNIASRIESLGVANSILLSKKVYDELQNKPNLTFKSLGQFKFKNIKAKQEVFAVANDDLQIPLAKEMGGKVDEVNLIKYLPWFLIAIFVAIGTFFLKSKIVSVEEAERSVAVLPFKNLSSDQDLNYFGDGIMDDILTNLAQLEELKVISGTSSLLYKNQSKSIPEIAKELDVSYIVVGSVQRDTEKMKIAAQLIRAQDDHQIWARNYIRDVSAVLEIQSEVSSDIANSLQSKISPGNISHMKQVPTESLEAYNLYQEGRHLLLTRGREEMQQSIEKFSAAIEIDPEFDRAWSEKATALFLLSNVGYDSPDIYVDAEQVAREALKINKGNAQAYAVLATIYGEKLEWANSIQMYEKALEISPNDALINYWYSLELREIAAFDRAIKYGEKAAKLDPLYPVIHMGHVVTCSYAGAFDKALEVLREKENIFGSSFMYHWASGIYYLCQKEYSDAIASFDQALTINPKLESLLAIKSIALGKLGRIEEIHQIRSSIPITSPRYYSRLVSIYAGLGVADSVFHYADKSIDAGIYKVEMNYANWYDPFRDDPRFDILLHKMKLLDQAIFFEMN